MDVRGATQTHYGKQKRRDRGKGGLRDAGIEWNWTLIPKGKTTANL